MNNKREELEKYINDHLLRRRYAEKTREAYLYWAMRIADFFGKYSIEEFSEEDISEFVKDVEDRQGLSSSTIKQAANALHFFFNTLGKCGYEIRGLRGKAVTRVSRYVPTQQEIISTLESIEVKRNRLAATLLYSAGLDLEEVISLRLIDIDFEHNVIRVPSKKPNGARNAVLAEYVKPALYSYTRESNARKWLFEARDGERVNPSSIQKAIAKAARRVGVKHPVSPKSLRYAYVKHLEALGCSLLDVLKELGMSHRSSFEYYAQLGREPKAILISPIDRRIPENDPGGQSTPDALYISDRRINELSEIKSSKFDLAKLIELLRELNVASRHQMYMSIAMLTRAILDHVPPVFKCETFAEVANNYQGGKSFKKQMMHLQNSLRNIADSYLHQKIRQSEALPTFNQMDFRADVDVLLGEIVRISRGT